MHTTRRFRSVAGAWLLSFAICAALIALSFLRIDVPMATYFFPISHNLNVLGGIGSAVILSIEATTAVIIVMLRMMRGKISPFGKTLAIACVASICAYAINDNVLKLYFGVPNPRAVVHGAKHAFHFWAGSGRSSFPSGHMVLAAAFAGVYMRLYRASILPLSSLLLLAAGLLIVGDWHFLSDLIAGTFFGLSAGLLAGEIWVAHSSHLAN